MTLTLYFGGVRITPSNYAGITVDNNAVATVIDLTDLFHKVTSFDTNMPDRDSTSDHANNRIIIGATADYDVRVSSSSSSSAASKEFEIDVFEISATLKNITNATNANPCVVSSASHGFNNGDLVKIDAVTGMTELNNKIYTVANAAANTFELNDDAGANVDSTGYGAYTAFGNIQLSTKTLCHTHREFAAGGDVGSWGDCSTIAPLTAGNFIESFLKNVSDANNITVEHISMEIAERGR